MSPKAVNGSFIPDGLVDEISKVEERKLQAIGELKARKAQIEQDIQTLERMMGGNGHVDAGPTATLAAAGTTEFVCKLCRKPAKSQAGLSAHMRFNHKKAGVKR